MNNESSYQPPHENESREFADGAYSYDEAAQIIGTFFGVSKETVLRFFGVNLKTKPVGTWDVNFDDDKKVVKLKRNGGRDTYAIGLSKVWVIDVTTGNRVEQPAIELIPYSNETVRQTPGRDVTGHKLPTGSDTMHKK